VEKLAGRRWPPGHSTAAAVLNSGGDREKQGGRQEEGENGLICNFKNFRDVTVNQQ
jgi:hypothetical protein